MIIKDFEYHIESETENLIITDKINGFLLGIFFIPFLQASYKKYDIRISLKNYPTILLLEEKQVVYEPIYIPIKVDYFNVNNRRYEAPDWWALNDKLRIEVEGKDIKLKIILRVKVY